MFFLCPSCVVVATVARCVLYFIIYFFFFLSCFFISFAFSHRHRSRLTFLFCATNSAGAIAVFLADKCCRTRTGAGYSNVIMNEIIVQSEWQPYDSVALNPIDTPSTAAKAKIFARRTPCWQSPQYCTTVCTWRFSRMVRLAERANKLMDASIAATKHRIVQRIHRT